MSYSLADMKPGEKGVITDCSEEHFKDPRLLEMGLVEGTEVEFIRKAPLGDPIQLKIRGYYLSIRKKDASSIQVEKVA
jgi:Fe2+ transport system protein FeoA